jgi:hypothetical protein
VPKRRNLLKLAWKMLLQEQHNPIWRPSPRREPYRVAIWLRARRLDQI